MVGQDGGQSIPLDDGRSLFLFSDTLLAPPPSPLPSHRGWFLGNCAAIGAATTQTLPLAMAELSYITDASGRPRELLPLTIVERAAGLRLWPEHGLCLDDKVIFFYLAIRQYESGTWGFAEVGTGLATLDLSTGHCVRWMDGNEWRPWPSLPPDCHCGVQLMRLDAVVYIFCSRPRGLHSEAFLARVPVAEMTQPRCYEFFRGEGPVWTQNFAEARPLTQCSSEYSVAFNQHLGCYLMTYVEAHTKQLCLRTAPEPWGPYSEALGVGIVLHHSSAQLVSLGFQHPQFDVDAGRTIFISYSQPHFTQNAMIELTFV
jgi:hypothetical protein